jgi:hypothetical protein
MTNAAKKASSSSLCQTNGFEFLAQGFPICVECFCFKALKGQVGAKKPGI